MALAAQVPSEELYHLVLRFLAAGPCQAAAQALEQQALALGLLPKRVDAFGVAHPQGLAALRRAAPAVPDDALALLLQQLLEARQACGLPGAQGLTTLLAPGPLATLPCLASTDAACSAPRWLARGHAPVSLPQSLMLSEVGVRARGAEPPAVAAAALCHAATVRGHKLAAYCVAWDLTGGRILTGSDDWLVKIWSARTCLLLRTCRGHRAEVSDFAISSDNRLAASGSCDTDVRVWSMEEDTLGFPVTVLRGHTAAITYLDFHPSLPHLLVSSCFDGTLRLWDATRQGAALHVLLPWHPFHAVLSAGDATAARRLSRTSASAGGAASNGVGGPQAAHPRAQGGSGDDASPAAAAAVRSDAAVEATPLEDALPVAARAADGEDALLPAGPMPGVVGMLNCCFSPCGTYLVAGANNCNSYLWQWNWRRSHHDPAAGTPSEAAPCGAGALAADWGAIVSGDTAANGDLPALSSLPAPRPLLVLAGHRNDISMVEFSHDGTGLATACQDGSVRVWRLASGGARGTRASSAGGAAGGACPPPAWREALVLVAPVDEAAAARARQRRRPLPVNAIHQAAWTLDDRRLLAACDDRSIRVWDAASGAQLHELRAHTDACHVVEGHPRDARLALSAGYDGLLALWDVEAGVMVASLDSRDSFPIAPGRWADPFPRVDGHWSPDGGAIALTDAAGQLSLYTLGPSPLLAHVPHDQFWDRDYGTLLWDSAGACLDADAQAPPHLLTGQQLLVDFLLAPYGEAVQTAVAAGRVRDLQPPVVGAALPAALGEAPPTTTAAMWAALNASAGAAAAQAAAARAHERHMEMLDALAHGRAPAAAEADVVGGGDGRRSAARRGRRSARASADAEDALAAEWEAVFEAADAAHSPSSSDYTAPSSEEDPSTGDGSSDSDAGDGGGSSERGPARRRARHSRRVAEAAAAVGAGPPSTARRASARRAGAGGGEGAADVRRVTRATAARLKRRRLGAGSREAARLQGAGGSEVLGGSGGEEEAWEEEEEEEEDGGRGSDLLDEVELWEEEEEGKRDSGGGARLQGRRPRRGQAAARTRAPRGTDDHRRRQIRRARKRLQRSERRRSGGGPQGRDMRCYAWLKEAVQHPSSYVPQLGDAAVYVWEGHRALLDAANDKRSPRPWLELGGGGGGPDTSGGGTSGCGLRPAEPCEVVGLEYFIADDATQDTLARVVLRLVGATSPLMGREFTVELPPPDQGHPEFLVPQQRFLAGVARQWQPGEQALVWWRSDAGGEEEEGGYWWPATVAEDTRAARPTSEVTADPFGCGGLWARYRMRWEPRQGDEVGPTAHDGGAGAEGAAAVLRGAALAVQEEHMSPWELFDRCTTVERALEELQPLDAAQASTVRAHIAVAIRDRRFRLFLKAPDPNSQWGGRLYNRTVALPLGLRDIHGRLSCGYYRHLAAVQHDVRTLAANAIAFNGDASEPAAAARRLVDWVAARLGGAPEGRPPAATAVQAAGEERERARGAGDAETQATPVAEDGDAAVGRHSGRGVGRARSARIRRASGSDSSGWRSWEAGGSEGSEGSDAEGSSGSWGRGKKRSRGCARHSAATPAKREGLRPRGARPSWRSLADLHGVDAGDHEDEGGGEDGEGTAPRWIPPVASALPPAGVPIPARSRRTAAAGVAAADAVEPPKGRVAAGVPLEDGADDASPSASPTRLFVPRRTRSARDGGAAGFFRAVQEADADEPHHAHPHPQDRQQHRHPLRQLTPAGWFDGAAGAVPSPVAAPTHSPAEPPPAAVLHEPPVTSAHQPPGVLSAGATVMPGPPMLRRITIKRTPRVQPL